MTATDAPTAQLCTFRLGDLLFGVEVRYVQEVIRYQEMTAVPLAPRCIRGLINLRGQIVTAVDMRVRFGLAEAKDSLPMNVVIRSGDGVVSLLVDEIGDVLQPDTSTFERVPETVEPSLREILGGIHKLDKGLLLLVDVDRLMATNGLGGAETKS